MDLSSYFENNTFMTSPMMRKLSLKIQKETKTGPVRNKKIKCQNQHMSSIFNRSFLSKSKPQKTQSLKQESQESIVLDNSNRDDDRRRIKTQQEHQQVHQQVKRKRQHSAFRKSRRFDSRNLQQLQINNSLADNIKTRSLTFQYYYKNIRQIQSKQKVQSNEQSAQKHLNHQLNRLFTNNLNHQMLQSMKRHIRKGLRVIQVGQKFMSQPILYYGLDIKGIQTKKPNNQTQSLPKGYKKYSAASLLVLKKQNSLRKIQNIQSSKSITDKKTSTIFTNLVGKKKSIQSKSSKQRYNFPQKQQQKTIFTRMEGMIQNMQLILHSFKCTLPRQNFINSANKQLNSPTKQVKTQSEKKLKKTQKFTYFVGYGNNRNLVRSLMKKRWWWTQTQYINEADFIWTQIKIVHILEEIQIENKSLSTKSQLSFESRDQILGIKFDTDINTLETLSKAQITFNKTTPKIKDSSENILQKQHQQKMFKIFHKQTPIQHLSLKISNLNSLQADFKHFSNHKKVHNHYRLNYMFGNKNALFHNLKMYFEFLKQEDILNTIIPKTYYLEKINKAQIKRFHQKEFLLNGVQKGSKVPNNIWIVKPAQNSNRGQGISVHTSFESIRKQICSSKSSGKFIVQSYMRNLFLYQRRKFDIRTYMIMLTINSTTKYFWYSEGYLRTSSQYYNLNDIENIFVHLTNDAIQCDSEKYGKFQPGNKLSYSQFQRYLDSNYKRQQYSVDGLNLKMKNIATTAVQAIHPKLKTEKVQYSFELFGLDFLVDKNFNPWLVQINTNPCLQLGCPVLQRLIPRMLQNMFRLCLDPGFQPNQQFTKASSYFIYDNFFDINRFELIFDSNYDQNSQWMDYCKNIEEKVYADDDEVFENDGQQMDVQI